MEVAELLQRYKSDFKFFSADRVNIKDHNTATIGLIEMNRGQRILHAVAEKQKAEKGYIRILLDKARRFGGSTYIESRFYWLTSQGRNRSAFIVGHEKESTNTLFQMAKLMHQKDPVAPDTLMNNEKALLFDTKDGRGLKSEYRLASAENVDAGRSQGIHYLHDSEEAFWRDADTLLTGLLQCVPDPPAESEVFRESTANGYGNRFQEDVFLAYCEGRYPYYEEDGIVFAWYNPKTDWVLVFIPWFVHARYSKEFEDEYAREEFKKRLEKKVFDEEDLRWVEGEGSKLKKKYGLSDEQLYWREWAIENKCSGSIDKFHQEYPSTVIESFLTEGSNVFGKELCDQLEEMCEDPIMVGDITRLAGKPRLKRGRHGNLSVWEKPDEKESYFITIDAAGGKKRRTRQDPKIKKEPDRTNIDVFNHRSGKQVAQWNGHIKYDLIADLGIMLGEMYNMSPICCELNNHGFTVVADLDRAAYPQYEMRDGEPGFLTTKKTKPQIVDGLYQMSRDGDLQIMSIESVNEMRTFIEDGGTYEASSGCKDDRVITAGMASQMMTLMPKKFKSIKRSKGKFVGFSNFVSQEKEKASGYVEYYA